MNETQETAQKLLEYVNPPQGQDNGGNRTRSNNPVARMTRHKEVMRRVLMGHKIKDIALDLGYNPASISVLTRTEAFQIELRRMQEIIFEHVVDEMSKFRKLVPFARQFYDDILNDRVANSSPRLKFDVSKDLLNRVGLKEAEEHNVHHDGVIGVNDVASLVSASFRKAQTMDVEAVRLDPEGELEKAERVAGDHQVSGDELAKELKELMSPEIIDIVMSQDDGLSRPDISEDAEPPSREEEESILNNLVESTA